MFVTTQHLTPALRSMLFFTFSFLGGSKFKPALITPYGIFGIPYVVITLAPSDTQTTRCAHGRQMAQL